MSDPTHSPLRRLALQVACFAVLCGGGATAYATPLVHSSVIPGPSAHVANLADWQFTVAVRPSRDLCTGVVIAPTKVLTAAHCLERPSDMQVIANKVSLRAAGGETLGVSGFAFAPGWTGRGFSNDLAVLTLSTPTTAPPIRLATPEENAAYTAINSSLEVAGFGLRNPLAWGKPKLGVLTASPAFVRSTRCGPIYVPAAMICDTGPRSKWVAFSGRKKRPIQSVPCSGDSGGPLVARTSSGPVLVGLTEAGAVPTRASRFYGVLCGLRGYNTVHTRVSAYLSFIQGNL
jgi:trypsin